MVAKYEPYAGSVIAITQVPALVAEIVRWSAVVPEIAQPVAVLAASTA